MSRTTGSAMAVALALAATAVVSSNTILRSALHDYRVVTVAEGLVQPSDGDIYLVTDNREESRRPS